jgi:8-oxo-dGTP diphosphatase
MPPKRRNRQLIVGVGVIILNKNNEILVGKRIKSGKYGLPGGKMDWGERVRVTASRELMEETELDIPEADFKVLETFNCIAPRYHSIEFTAAARIPEGMKFYNPEPDTCAGWEWMSLEKLRTEMLFEPLRERIERGGVITTLSWEGFSAAKSLELEWEHAEGQPE